MSLAHGYVWTYITSMHAGHAGYSAMLYHGSAQAAPDANQFSDETFISVLVLNNAALLFFSHSKLWHTATDRLSELKASQPRGTHTDPQSQPLTHSQHCTEPRCPYQNTHRSMPPDTTFAFGRLAQGCGEAGTSARSGRPLMMLLHHHLHQPATHPQPAGCPGAPAWPSAAPSLLLAARSAARWRACCSCAGQDVSGAVTVPGCTPVYVQVLVVLRRCCGADEHLTKQLRSMSPQGLVIPTWQCAKIHPSHAGQC